MRKCDTARILMISRRMWIFLFIIVLLVAAYAAYSYAIIHQASVVGHRIAAQAVPYEQHPPNPAMYILVMGDSTAVGTGAATNTESIAGRLGARYPQADI